jgi:hypothetical protein
MEGLVEEFYEDNGDNYIDDTEGLTDLAARGAQIVRVPPE